MLKFMSDNFVVDEHNNNQFIGQNQTATGSGKLSSKHLLDAYLKNKNPQHNPNTNPSAFSSTNQSPTTPTTPSVENSEESKNNNNSSSSTNSTNYHQSANRSRVKELGSIEAILKGRPAVDTPTATNPTSIYQESNLFPHQHKDSDHTTITSSPPPHSNLSLMALAVFGAGAVVFGITQFIKQATPNYAAPNNLNLPATPQAPIVQAPQIMAFQGRLLGVRPDPVDNTYKVKLRFKMYNVETSGAPVWDSNDCYPITLNAAQIFNVNLGGNNSGGHAYNCGPPLGDIFAHNASIWLEIIANGEVLSPRQVVKSVPYALNAASLQGLHASASATANTIPVLDQFGNLNFNSPATAITNTGDLYLLPASGKMHIGSDQHPTDLHLTGNATVSGTLQAAAISVGDNGLKLQTALGQQLWEIATNGNLGLGTTNASQKITLGKSHNLAFEINHDQPNWHWSIPNLSANGNGNLSAGDYYYRFTCINEQNKESLPSRAVKITHSNSTQTEINNLPEKSTDCRSVNIYRTALGSQAYYLVASKTPDGSNYIDNLSNTTLQLNQSLPLAGIYAGKYLAVQFGSDGSLLTNQRFNAATHADNQGLRLPTYAGTPTPKQGQEVGDIVYDSTNAILYLYNGSNFVPLTSNNSYCQGNNCQVGMEPEYAGAIMTISTQSQIEGKSQNGKNYYSIRSNTSSENTIVVNYTIPANFKAWHAQKGISLDFATAGNDGSGSKVNVTVSNSTNNNSPIAHLNLYSQTHNEWRQDYFTADELNKLNFKAGNTLTFTITTQDDNEEVKIGRLLFNYLTN